MYLIPVTIFNIFLRLGYTQKSKMSAKVLHFQSAGAHDANLTIKIRIQIEEFIHIFERHKYLNFNNYLYTNF